MDFRTATDAVADCISHHAIAERLGVHVQRIRQARLDPDSPGHRPAPAGWQEAVAALAAERAAALARVAKELRAHR